MGPCFLEMILEKKLILDPKKRLIFLSVHTHCKKCAARTKDSHKMRVPSDWVVRVVCLCLFFFCFCVVCVWCFLVSRGVVWTRVKQGASRG